tara:strand:- start:1520 stop:3472 length:1953 start_codon:yes stop_codon:yes gene_type:complete
MTSINLVSPKGNGHTYSVKFRDPIILESNSKVYLNFAKFKRNSNIYFTTDQTIQIVINEVKPTIVPATGLSNLRNFTITIPSINPITGRTGYTAKDLEDAIYQGVRNLQQENNTPTQLFLYSPIYAREETNLIQVGLYQDVVQTEDDRYITLSATNIIGGGQGGSQEFSYIKTSADATGGNTDLYYDNYALSNEHYNFFFSPTLGAQDVNHNLIHIRTNTTVGTQIGNISFGLSSPEVANGSGAGGWTEYASDGNNIFTNGTVSPVNTGTGAIAKHNPAIYLPNATNCINSAVTGATLASAVLGSYLTIEITGANHPNRPQTLIVWRGINYQSARRLKLGKPDSVMNRMTEVWSVGIASLIGSLDANNTKLELAFQTYWGGDFSAKKGGLANGNDKLNFRIFNQTLSTQLGKEQIIYDSENSLNWLYYTFFNRATNTGTLAVKGEKANSQIPFNLIMSATKQDEGFDFIKMDGFNKNFTFQQGAVASDANPLSYVVDYKMEISGELSGYLGVNSTTLLNPNMDAEHADKISKEDAEQHEDESYSIFLKNFPISAYKNIQSKAMGAGDNIQDGGYAQPILYDVPTPYTDSKIINVGSGDVLVGTFQPSIIKKLELKNQKMVLNNIDVEIRDIETNEIANGLTGSVVNFTIE